LLENNLEEDNLLVLVIVKPNEDKDLEFTKAKRGEVTVKFVGSDIKHYLRIKIDLVRRPLKTQQDRYTR
jgi:hypothetical protein